MIIDRSHQAWIVVTLLLGGFATGLYAWYAAGEPHGPTGGSWQGLLFGIAGSLCMLFAGLLSSRKKVPRWNVGSAQFWLKGHIYLGLLSVPLILFHSGFRLGGVLEMALMIVFAIVIVSGLLGILLQQYLPRLMKTTVFAQAIYEQLPQACSSLRRAGDECVSKSCGSLMTPASSTDPRPTPAGPALAKTRAQEASSSLSSTTQSPAGQSPAGQSPAGEPGSPPPNSGASMSPRASFDAKHELKSFYLTSVRPFLHHPVSPHPSDTEDGREAIRLTNKGRSDALFSQVRDALPPELHDPLNQLERLAEERRQLWTQERIHHWLHGWLLLHVPLSFALLVLAVAHIVFSSIVY